MSTIDPMARSRFLSDCAVVVDNDKTSGQGNNLREKAGTSERIRIISEVSVGALVRVDLDSKTVKDNTVWWKVTVLGTNREGWMAEFEPIQNAASPTSYNLRLAPCP
jgi:hypothetical protein